jgi:hypothetical protein
MQSAVPSTICRTAPSLPQPSRLRWRMMGLPLQELIMWHPVLVWSVVPMLRVALSDPPRWKYLHRGPTSSPCTGALHLYSFCDCNHIDEQSLILE